MFEQTPLPASSKLDIRPLTRAFRNTTATYKFYWLLALLKIVTESENPIIDARQIAVSVIALAWYPITFFRISFGPNDRLGSLIDSLRHDYTIPANIPIKELVRLLTNLMYSDAHVRKSVDSLLRYVPYRFLSPWIPEPSDSVLTARSRNFENNCLYKLCPATSTRGFTIEINPQWLQYLNDNIKLIEDFAYWNLTQFLQLRNPNVPCISAKLTQPTERKSLSKQKKFWDFVMGAGMQVKCIYTDRELNTENYALDHFIPWSFVSHDLLWDLIPADPSINSSKSDKLPDISFLPKLAHNHQKAISICLGKGQNPKVLEDYLSLGKSAEDIALMPEDQLIDLYKHTFEPMEQIAGNMGFESWSYKPLTLF